MTESIYTIRYKVLREILVRSREKAGYSQRVLSAKLGRASSFVNKYELGERRLDVVELIWIAKVLKIDPVEILKELINTPE